MRVKITSAMAAAFLTAGFVNATAFAPSHSAEHQTRSKAKAGPTALGFRHSDGIPTYDEVGQQTGVYRGPILGYGGTSCSILTPGGFIHVCQYDYN
jgi:hypothetical protein